jgi:hypothetical protein
MWSGLTSAQTGHYLACVRRPDGLWLRIDGRIEKGVQSSLTLGCRGIGHDLLAPRKDDERRPRPGEGVVWNVLVSLSLVVARKHDTRESRLSQRLRVFASDLVPEAPVVAETGEIRAARRKTNSLVRPKRRARAYIRYPRAYLQRPTAPIPWLSELRGCLIV